jgi:hypothetical protein
MAIRNKSSLFDDGVLIDLEGQPLGGFYGKF